MFENNEIFVICPEMGFFMTKNCLCSKLPTKCTKYRQNLFFPLFGPIMSHYDYEKTFEKFRTSSSRKRHFHPIWCITWWSYAYSHSDRLWISKWGKSRKLQLFAHIDYEVQITKISFGFPKSTCFKGWENLLHHFCQIAHITEKTQIWTVLLPR